jgi:putative addiction module component
MPHLNDILRDALEHTVQRATLAEELLAGLDHLPQTEAEKLRTEESQRRRNDLHAGRVRGIDSAGALAKAAELLGKEH